MIKNTEEAAVLKPVGVIHTDFKDKFGIPRQSGLVDELTAKIVFYPEYRSPEAFREIEGFSHLWLVWRFTEAVKGGWRPTVRPPRLGGNRRVGVFASRSPFRPNFLGLSCVRFVKVDYDPADGPTLIISGADILDGTPIYDVKPYVPLSDCKPDAAEGYTKETKIHSLEVEFPEKLLGKVPSDKQKALIGVLSEDPRPGYEDDAERIYGLSFAGLEVRFKVSENTLTVVEVE